MASSVRTCDPSAPLGLRRGALTACRWLLLAFLLAGAGQIFLAGLGVFSLNGDGDDRESAFGPHRSLGGAIAGIAVVILILALITGPGRRAIILSGLLVLLTGFMQNLLAGLADNATVFGGLHVLDGLLILAIAGFLYASARRWRS
jgi:hypothetical protein